LLDDFETFFACSVMERSIAELVELVNVATRAEQLTNLIQRAAKRGVVEWVSLDVIHVRALGGPTD